MELYSIVDASDYETPVDSTVTQTTFCVRFLYDNMYYSILESVYVLS